MTGPRIPAAERDLAREDPQLPPASRQVSSTTNSVLGSLAIALGVMIVVVAVIAAVFQVSPLPRDVFNTDEITAVILAAAAGLCFIGCGIGILRRSLLLPLAMLCGAVVCGFLSTVAA